MGRWVLVWDRYDCWDVALTLAGKTRRRASGSVVNVFLHYHTILSVEASQTPGTFTLMQRACGIIAPSSHVI